MNLVIYFVLAYLIGSISPAYFFGKLKGKDLRKIGTKNLGAANTYLSIGLIPAMIVVIFDIAKGFFSIMLGDYFGFSYIILIIGGSLAILGHDFPFYLEFIGGKGTATTIGVIGALLFILRGKELIISIIAVLAVYLIAKVIIIKTQKRAFWG